jgi:hypothetical protein
MSADAVSEQRWVVAVARRVTRVVFGCAPGSLRALHGPVTAKVTGTLEVPVRTSGVPKISGGR